MEELCFSLTLFLEPLQLHPPPAHSSLISVLLAYAACMAFYYFENPPGNRREREKLRRKGNEGRTMAHKQQTR